MFKRTLDAKDIAKWILEWRDNGYQGDSVYDFLMYVDEDKFNRLSNFIKDVTDNGAKHFFHSLYKGNIIRVTKTLSMIESYDSMWLAHETAEEAKLLIDLLQSLMTMVEEVRSGRATVENGTPYMVKPSDYEYKPV